MKDVLLLIDHAEKQPLIFPDYLEWTAPSGYKHRTRIYTEVRKIDTGDYVLASHPTVGVVERKNGLGELYDNLFTKDARRFNDCLERLARMKAPALYLEASLGEFQRLYKMVRPIRAEFPGTQILDRLLQELARARMVLLTGTGRNQHGKRQGGELVARYLILAAHGDTP